MNLGAETEWVEFKRTTGELREGLISLSSMLNKHGYGTLYFGVRDDGEVTGQLIGDRTLREISQAIASHIKPQIIPTITLELLTDCNVIKVYVQGADTPYSAYGRYFMRSYDEDREISPAQLRALLLDKADSDIITKITAPDTVLGFRQLRTLYAARGLSVNEESFEQNLGLKSAGGGYNLMAYLLCDVNDVSIKVATFAGLDKSLLLRRKEFGLRCLPLALEQVISYVESLNDTAVTLGGSARVEERLFEPDAFREAWINACLHTRWDRLNPPAVYVFSDRLEIISTGGLPADLSEEEFFRGISRPVNLKLQKIFGQLGFVEQTGHGIPLIIAKYGRQAFEIMDNYLNVVIPFNRRVQPVKRSTSSPELNEAQQNIYNLLAKTPQFTIEALVKASGFSDGYVRKILSQLKDLGALRRLGSRKNGHWQVQGIVPPD